MSDKTTRRPPIKPVSREKKKRSSALRECRCFDEVDRRLRMGTSSADLVKFIQEENEELVDLSPSYISKMIGDYRSSIPPLELMQTSKNTSVMLAAQRKISNGLNELDELEKLFKKQSDRIDIDIGNEKKLNKLFAGTGREVFYAMKILKQSADLKMDLGIAKRQLGEVSVIGQASAQVSDRYHSGIGKVMADPDSRRKVFSMVNSLISRSERSGTEVADLISNAVDMSSTDVIDVANEEQPVSDQTDGD